MKKYIETLASYPYEQSPLAARFFVNEMAAVTRKKAVHNVKRKFITRNKYTVNRIQFEQSQRTRNVSDVQSAVGALDTIDYMAEQENGATLRSSDGGKLPVPTRSARVSNSIARRKKKATRLSQIGTMLKHSQFNGRTKNQKIAAMLGHVAKTKTKKLLLIPFNKSPGIYRLKSTRKSGRVRLSLIYKLDKYSMRIMARPWLEPATQLVMRHADKFADKAWNKFLSKLR